MGHVYAKNRSLGYVRQKQLLQSEHLGFEWYSHSNLDDVQYHVIYTPSMDEVGLARNRPFIAAAIRVTRRIMEDRL